MNENKTTAAPKQEYIAPLKMGEKLGFGAFSTASNVVYQFKSMYYLFFLTDVLLIPMGWAGTILTIGTIWDAVNDPLIGFWAVNHKFKNGERCRPMALWFSVPWAITLVLLFTDFGTNNWVTIAIAIAVYIVFETFNTFVNIPYNSMGSLATNRDSDRRSINVFRNLGGVVGSGIGAVAILPLMRLFGALDTDGNLRTDTGPRGFFIVAAIMGLVCIAGCLAHYFTTKERVRPISDSEEKIGFFEGFAMLLRSRSWVLNMFYIMCYAVIVTLTLNCINYYATYVIGSTAAATPIMAAYLVVSIVVSLLVAPIDKRLGRKNTMIAAIIVFILGKVWFIVDPYSTGAIYVNAVSVGVAVTIAFVMFNTNRNNIADLVEWREGRRIDSLVSTADNLASKLMTAGATWFLAYLMTRGGYDAALTAQPQGAIDAISALLGWIPALVGAVMLVVVLFMHIDRDMAEMEEEKGLSHEG